jgi:two-component system, OmpR family, sensor kinase
MLSCALYEGVPVPALSDLSFRSKLLALLAILLVIAIVPAAAALHAVSLSSFHIERSNLAHDVLDGYLELAERSQLLLGHLAAPTGDPAVDRDVRERLEGEIAREFRSIRQLVATEVALLSTAGIPGQMENSADEAEELEMLAQIERELYGAIRRQAATRDPLNGAANTAQPWRRLVSNAILEEKREVDEVDLRAATTARRLQIIVGASVTLALVLAIWLASLLLRGLNRPVAQLMQGTRELAQGNFSHRIAMEGRGEFARLGASFDQMADDLERQRGALARSQEYLEVQVAERTAELTAANAQLAVHNDTRRRFLTDVSHELRTPLTVVRGEAEVALRGREKSVDDYKAALSRISEQAGHMGRLVDDLLFVARTASGEVRLQLRAVQLTPLVHRVCADMTILARKSGGTVECDVIADDLVVQGDPDRLRQLLLILVDNALRYTREAPDVTVALLRATDGAILRVSDRGIGIPAHELPHVFERFHRAANAELVADGVGLGLQMAKAIVEADGGTIGIESVEGHGTTVSVRLPGGVRLRTAA